MKRYAAPAILKANAPELKALGVSSLSLFGSAARDAACDDSDVGAERGSPIWGASRMGLSSEE
jgi:predicted nucleotidyltransferase